MIAVLTLAAATIAMIPPQPSKGSVPDLRVSVLDTAHEGSVIFSLFTDPKGKPFKCDVEKVIDADFSEFVCDEYMKTRFKAAIDRDGRPAYGQYRSIVNFRATDPSGKAVPPMGLAPEIMLSVKPIPGLLTARRDISIAVKIDGEGKVADCMAVDATDNSQLVKTACAQARAEWTGTQLEVPGTGLVSYVRAMTVAFVPEGK